MILGQLQYWFFLLAGALPILIHLLSRRVRRREPLPTVRFLEEAMRMSEGRRRIRDLMLLLMRSLALLLIMGALCRPYIYSSLPLPPAPASAVLVLDNTISMTGREPTGSWWQIAVEWCRSFVDQWTGEIAFLTADRSGRIVSFTTEKPLALHTLQRATVSRRVHDLTFALQSADAALEKRPALYKVIVLVTDGQSQPIRSGHLPVLTHPLKVVLVRSLQQPGNVRLEALSLPPMDPGRLPIVVTRLRNMSHRDIRGTVRVRIGRSVASDRTVALRTGSRQQWRTVIPKRLTVLTDPTEGTVGQVEWVATDGDVLSADDRLPFRIIPHTALQIGIGLTAGRERAAQALRATGLRVVPFTSANLSSCDSLIVFTPRDRVSAERVARWVARGKAAIVFADNPVSPLWTIVSLRVSKKRSLARSVRFVDEGWVPLRGLYLALRTVWSRSEWTVSATSPLRAPRASFTGGIPFILEHRFGGGRFLFVFASPDPRESNLFFTAAFLPLLHRLAVYAAYNGFVAERAEEFADFSGSVPVWESEMRLPPLRLFETQLKRAGVALVSGRDPNSISSLQPPWRDLSPILLLVGALLVALEGFISGWALRRGT